MFKQFLGGKPVVQLDPCEATALDPEVISLLLDFGLAGIAGLMWEGVFSHDGSEG